MSFTSRTRDILTLAVSAASRPSRIWAASPTASGWKRRPLTLPGDFGAPVAYLDPEGTLHLTSSRAGSWFIFYLQLPDFAPGFDEGQDFTAISPHVPWRRICKGAGRSSVVHVPARDSSSPGAPAGPAGIGVPI